jgi:uncharacterized RDD family membrane protein YckC
MASPQVTPVETSPPVYAALGRRLAAYVIDVLLVLGLLFMVAFAVRGLRAIGLWAPSDSAVPPEQLWRALGVGPKLLIVLAYFISLGPMYVILFHASGWQATIGKRLAGIYVTDDAGNRITLSRSCGRWFAQFLVDSFTRCNRGNPGAKGRPCSEWKDRSMAMPCGVHTAIRLDVGYVSSHAVRRGHVILHATLISMQVSSSCCGASPVNRARSTMMVSSII